MQCSEMYAMLAENKRWKECKSSQGDAMSVRSCNIYIANKILERMVIGEHRPPSQQRQERASLFATIAC